MIDQRSIRSIALVGLVILLLCAVFGLAPAARATLAQETFPNVHPLAMPPQTAATSGGLIAYVGADGNLWVAKPDGSELRQVTTSFTGVTKPTWSPDGNLIVFGEGSTVYVVGGNGSEPKAIASGIANASFFDWSPDGSRIVFSGDAGGATATYVVGADGSALARLAADLPQGMGASWSPDGRWVALPAQKPDGSWGIFKVDVSGQGGAWLPGSYRCTFQICGCPQVAYTYFAAWAPSSSSIAFVGVRTEEYWCGFFQRCCRAIAGLYVVDASSNLQPRWIGDLSTSDNPSSSAAWHNLVWSPDGSELAAMALRSDGSWHACVSTATGAVRQLNGRTGTEAGSLAWSPDGQQLVASLGEQSVHRLYLTDPAKDTWSGPLADGSLPDWTAFVVPPTNTPTPTSPPAPTPTPTPSETPAPSPTPTPTATRTPTPTPTRPTNVDFTIERIEVVQAVQTLADEVPLVAEKPALVRVWVDMGGFDGPGSVCCATGILDVRIANGNEWHLTPENSGGRIEVFRQPDPNILDHSLNFRLPPKALLGSVTVTATVNQDQSVPEADPNNNKLTRELTFQPTQSLHIIWVPVTDFGVVPPDENIAWGAASFMRKTYPIPPTFGLRYEKSIQTLGRWWVSQNGENRCKYEEWPDCAGTIKEELVRLQKSQSDPDAIVFGWLPAVGGQFDHGGSSLHGFYYLPGWAPAAWGSTDVGMAGVHLAHEVGHAMALCHPGDTANDNCAGRLGPPFDKVRVPPQRIGVAGIDVAENRVLRSDSYSLMLDDSRLPEATRWISPVTYTRIFEMLHQGAHASDSQQAEAILLVSGTLSADGSARLSPALAFQGYADTMRDDPAKEFRLRLLGKSEEVLIHQDFGLGISFPEEDEAFAFAVPLPAIGSPVQRIELLKDERVLTSINAGQTPPKVNLLAPQGGELWSSGDTKTIEWTASDADGDALTYALFYSTDGGQTWQPIHTSITDTQYAVNTSELPGGQQVLIKVLATDGINTASSTTDGALSVETKGPELGINAPEDGQRIVRGTTMDLMGWAFDPEDGDISSEGLTWYGPQDQELGTGPWLQLKPAWEPGIYAIRLEAEDSEGHRRSAAVTISYGLFEHYLPVLLR